MKNKLTSKGWFTPRRIIAAGVFFAFAAIAVLNGDHAAAQQILKALKNPDELKNEKSAKRGGDVNYTLTIDYAKNTIPNPGTGRDDTVNLRSYNGKLVGPTVKILPGNLLRMNLINNLSPKDPSCVAGTDMNTPHCFNSTNLHTHGWHVSPAGNSDNVLLDIKPQTSFDYEYYLPKDHPAGTFWYHSHRHGSTALQVSSGMAGALIVEGRRKLADKGTNGIADIDTIFKDTMGRPFTDRVMMFEQIVYDCGKNADGSIKWKCEKGDVGTIESYAGFGSSSWKQSGRFTLINGQLQPLIEMEAGQIERWRLIHGGVRDTINFRVTRSKVPFNTREEMMKKLEELQKQTPEEQNHWLTENCAVAAGSDVRQAEFAVDGLTRKSISAKMMNVLQPGYRSDVLMAFDKPGVYCVLDDATPPVGSINMDPVQTGLTAEGMKSVNLNDRRLLSMVFVSGGKGFEGEPQNYIAQQLVDANQDLPDAVKKGILRLNIQDFAPHQDIPETKQMGKQELSFAVRQENGKFLFQVANKIDPKPSDYFSYDPDRIDRKLVLGGTDEWKMTSRFASHPFHIHVNPFQIVDILKPDGKSVIKDGKCDDGVDPQYCDQIGVFRDTMFVKQNPASTLPNNLPGYVVIARTKYERYIGDFVLHCHILDHEDSGMMQNVRIVPMGGYLEGNPTPTDSKHMH